MDARQRALGLRDGMIRSLAEDATALVLEPEPGRAMDKALEALGTVEDACASMIKTLHTSSHAMYAERDLGDVTADWTRARHAMRTLRLLYGPRVAPCPDPGHHADPPPRFPIPQREQDDARMADDGRQR